MIECRYTKNKQGESMKKYRVISILIVLSVLFTGCQSNNTKYQNNVNSLNTKVEKVDKSKIFVSMEWVKNVIDGKDEEYKNAIIVEGSWGKTEENDEYLNNHLPKAIYIDTDDLEHDAELGVSDKDNYNIKSGEEVEKVLLKNGITKDTKVIVYGSTVGASRVAFILLWAGVEDVKLMSGNINSWISKGYKVDKDIPSITEKTSFGINVPAHPEWIIDDKEVYNNLENNNFKLISIRSIAEYNGETSGYTYIDYAGEPKGALWGHAGSDAYSMEDYIDKDGYYRGYDVVERYMKDIGVSKNNLSAFYCGTGWRACIPWLILHENGWNNIKLYDGGWWQWLTNPEYPVQVGSKEKGNLQEVKVKDLVSGKKVNR